MRCRCICSTASDGAPYISAGLDVMRFRDAGASPISAAAASCCGAARPRASTSIAPSDPRAIYLEARGQGRKDAGGLYGRYPRRAIFMAAVCLDPPMDELEVLGALRGAPVPVVKMHHQRRLGAGRRRAMCWRAISTSSGQVEPEGAVRRVSSATTASLKTQSGVSSHRDHASQGRAVPDRHDRRQASRPHRHGAARRGARPRSAAWAGLVTSGARAGGASAHAVERRHVQRARLDPSARAGRGAQRHRRGVRQHRPNVKQVFVFDDDIDVFSDEQCDWALATRYQGDRDTIQASGFRVVPLDPSLGGQRVGAKIGFDCTIPFGQRQSLEWGIPMPPEAKTQRRVRQEVGDRHAGRGTGELP